MWCLPLRQKKNPVLLVLLRFHVCLSFLFAAQSDEAEKIAEKVKFGEFDTNKDGFLDTQEMKPWIIPSTMENSKEEAEHIMSEADTNKDNILTKEEILENFETFVGSQATDYGKHLHLVHEEL